MGQGENVDHSAPTQGNTNNETKVPESTLVRQSLEDVTNKKPDEQPSYAPKPPPKTRSQSPRRDFTAGNTSNRDEPTAIRSSFTVGGAVPNEERFNDTKS